VSRRLLAIALTVSLTANLVAVFALGTYWHRASRRPLQSPPPDRAQALSQLKERFHLTDAQMDTMRALKEYRHASLRPVNDRLQAQQKEILLQLQSPELNKPLIDSLQREIVAARETLETGALEVLLRMRNVLTPEQRRQLPELFAELQQAGRSPGSGPGETPQPGHRPPQGPPGR
jgi:Spy/CpxP family protein refolding chaperone